MTNGNYTGRAPTQGGISAFELNKMATELLAGANCDWDGASIPEDPAEARAVSWNKWKNVFPTVPLRGASRRNLG
jgi:hypothetical protein